MHTEEVEGVEHEIANLVWRWRGEGRGDEMEMVGDMGWRGDELEMVGGAALLAPPNPCGEEGRRGVRTQGRNATQAAAYRT